VIEALYDIGLSMDTQDFLDEFIEDIGEGYKNVFKIVIDINNDEFSYKKIELEEFSKNKKRKYLYKGVKGNACNYTPTAKITDIDKTYNTKILKSIDTFIKNNGKYIKENDIVFLQKVNNILKNDKDKILDDIKNLIKNRDLVDKKGRIKDGGILTISFEKNGKELYLGDISAFTNSLRGAKVNAYSKYYRKYKKVSKEKNKVCYLCGEVKDEVWGFVDTYKFYTVDKEGMVTGGFKQELAWRNYPVCPDCALVLERGKKYVESNLNWSFCGFTYFVIPQLVYKSKDNTLLKQVLKRMKSYESFSLTESATGRIQRTEEKILQELSKENNLVNFNFVFYKKTNSAFNILLEMQEIAPTRLQFLINAKEEVDNIGNKYKIFEEIKTKKGSKQKTISLDFSFQFIRDFFTNSKIEGNFDKSFFEIIDAIFIGHHVSNEFLLRRFMSKIRSDFLNDRFYGLNVLKAYKILLYIDKLGLLQRRKGEMSNKKTEFEDFFNESRLIDDDLKKALFLEGVLAKKLLEIQYSEREATPFQSRLNGLRIDKRVAMRLLPEIINKLEEYGKNYYQNIENAIGEYFVSSNFAKYSVDEMSFYFTLGMTLAKHFNNSKKEE
jgi:CRISPR-associated protein Csh1